MIVEPFRAWRPTSDLAAKVPSPPYDVLSTAEARGMARDDPHSFLRVVRPEIGFDEGVDPHDDRVYEAGRDNLREMIRQGWLVRDTRPSYYVYRMTVGDHEQTGLVGLASVEDYDAGRIRKHEHTRPAKEEDRARHIHTMGAQAGPVLLAYRDDPALQEAVNATADAPPAAEFSALDGVRHALWAVAESAAVGRIREAISRIPVSYIADGHHRAAAAARVAARRADGSADTFLAIHFPASEMRVHAYNRLVRTLGDRSPSDLLARVREAGFEVAEGSEGRRPEERWTYGMYLDRTWYVLSLDRSRVPMEDPVRSLDVAVLSDLVLEPILGIGDPRTDDRIDFVGGVRGPEELERRVDSGEHAVAFSLHPTRLEDVMRVADAGGVMPPKSTWFEPKARSGMVVHTFD
jgi:uncharacterized protein (DUF1015 family)